MAKRSLDFYRDAWKAIRRDVSFKINLRNKLSPAQKAMITRYHTEIKNQTGFRPTQRYVSKSPQSLKAVQAYTGQEKGFPGLKAAYIPIPNGTKAKVRVSKSGKVKVTTNSGDMGEIQRTGYLFEKYGDVASDPSGVVEAILVDDAGASVRFNMMCGANESSVAFSKKYVEQEVLRYLNEYDETEKWFRGIIGYSFDGQADFDTYLAKRKEKPRRAKNKMQRKSKGKRKR